MYQRLTKFERRQLELSPALRLRRGAAVAVRAFVVALVSTSWRV
jgi:hypothetical protein